MAASDPRGLRNNNPLNLSYVPGQAGLDPAAPTDGRFGRYTTPEDGIAAAVGQLRSYQTDHGLATPQGMISRWAPPSENNTAAYVRNVASTSGLDPNKPVDMTNPDHVTRLVGSMAQVENGKALDPATLQRGVTKALGPSAMSDSDFLSHIGGATPAPTQASPFNLGTQSAAPESDADFLARIAPGATPAPAAAPAADPSQPAPAQQPLLARIGAGIQQGVMDVPQTAAKALAGVGQWVNDRVPALARLDQATGMSADNITQGINADQAAYNAQYGQDAAAGAGRIGGQLVATLPLMGAAGRGIAAGGDAIAPGVGTFLNGGATGNLLTRAASGAASGATQGAGVAALTSGSSDAPVGQQILSGAQTGALLGGAMPAVASGIKGAARGLAGIGADVDPEVARLAQVARQMGIPITAPQMSSNSLARIASDQSGKLPFSGAGASAGAQQAGFNRAIAAQMGETATRVTPDVMDAAATRIGAAFNGVASRTTIQADRPFLLGLQRIAGDAAQTLPKSEQAPLNAQITNLLDAATTGNGAISGDAYQALTRRGGPLDRVAQSSDPNLAHYGQQIRNTLDDAFQRSASPADQAALTEARSQWRAMKTVEDLVEKSPTGDISPALLMGQVRSASTRFDGSTSGMAYTGGGPMGDLARIGQQFLKAPPDSGTAGRMLVNGLVGGGGGTSIVAAATGMVNPLTLAAVPSGLLANRLAGNYIRSNGLAERFIASGLAGPNAPAGPVNRLLRQGQPYVAPAGVLMNRPVPQ